MDHENGDTLIKRRKNHIWIGSEINEELLIELQKEVFDVYAWENQVEESYAPLTLHIHGLGGDAFSGLAMYDLLLGYPGEVTTIIEGVAASAASIVFMAGDHRYIRPSGFILIHNPSIFLSGKYPDIKDHLRMMELLNERIIQIYQRSGQTRDRIETWLNHESWFNAQTASVMGLAEIQTSLV